MSWKPCRREIMSRWCFWMVLMAVSVMVSGSMEDIAIGAKRMTMVGNTTQGASGSSVGENPNLTFLGQMRDPHNFNTAVAPSFLQEKSLRGTTSKNNTNNTCSSHTSCLSCYQYSTVECHWCPDNTCHARGSVHGCAWGQQCPSPPSPPPSPTPAPTPKPLTGCAAYSSCHECASNSKCHWCGFDEACHTKGSVYGCVSGVNCYANQRCQRKNPQHVSKPAMAGVPPAAIIVICTMAAVLLCCLTAGLCVAGAAKGAYDDLTGLLVTEVVHRRSNDATPSVTELTPRAPLVSNKDDTNDDGAESPLTQQLLPTPQQQQTPSPLESASATSSYTLYPPPKPQSKFANCLFSTCQLLYLLLTSLLLLLTTFLLLYYPQPPIYNVCSNEFDWGSIVQSVTSMQPTGSFQLLFSLYNPNKFDLELNHGQGVFYHGMGVKETQVGSFTIPPKTIVYAQSITDVLVTTSFTVDKWQTLELGTEYYLGTLEFRIDASVVVSSGMWGGYGYTVKFEEYDLRLADVNEDRTLCGCQWEGKGNRTATALVGGVDHPLAIL